MLLRRFEHMSFKRSLTALGVFICAMILVMAIPLLTNKSEENLVIGGKLGSEPEILINMYKLLIENETDLNVELQPGLGKTSFVFNALKSGSIDAYPEFTGTAIAEFLKETAVSTDSGEVYEQARKGMKEQYDMELLEPMAYNNTYALAVPKQLAEEFGLQSISDLKAVEKNIKAGFTLEFSDREDGYRGIQELYGVEFPTVLTMEPKLRYGAIEKGEINLVDAYSTDSEIERYNLTVLEDDKNLFPPYQGAPLLRAETVEEHPELVRALNKLSGKISDDEMREMNYKVNVEGASAEETAREYLEKEGLLK
jgi:osmoprotectant transport system permease protein